MMTDPAGDQPATMTTPDPRALPRLLSTSGGSGLDAHFQQWGQMPAGGPLLIEEVDRAGLRGRGGAGFPTAAKLRAVASARHGIVVANGTEGEPASSKDKVLLQAAPHLVLDGASIAAETVGASEVVICVDRTATAAIRAVQGAITERVPTGADRVTFRLEATPSGYLTGEESALVHWLNGGDAKPTFIPPRPFERGVRGRPTLVNNVETLAHLALIARFGAGWFRRLGSSDDPGSALVTFTGDVVGPGVCELPLGIPLPEALRVAGVGSEPQALLIGGYAGTWIPGSAGARVRLDRTSLRALGASLGCGVITVLGPGSCGLTTAALVARWLAGQSAGQCGPCANGLPAIAQAMEALVAGDRRRRREEQLRRWLDQVEGRGACHHPDGAARFVRSALTVFSKEIGRHRQHGPCGAPAAPVPLPEREEAWR
jgi:NADH:ubiquinone oxidoreductase subunit F (NADH-binding)